jgi:secreted PhoX family phosphatase
MRQHALPPLGRARDRRPTALADFRNEPNQFGWVVEIDPYSPDRRRASAPRSAASAMKAAGPAFVAGRSRPSTWATTRGANISTSSSRPPWVAADATAADRLAIGDKYLDAGTLYVAKFNADGTGTWLPLQFGTAPLDALERRLSVRRPGRHAGQHPPGRRCAGRDQDGSSGMDRGQSGERRSLSDADQQHDAHARDRVPMRPIRAL